MFKTTTAAANSHHAAKVSSSSVDHHHQTPHPHTTAQKSAAYGAGAANFAAADLFGDLMGAERGRDGEEMPHSK